MWKFLSIFILIVFLQSKPVVAGSEGNEDLKSKSASSSVTAEECFEGTSRAVFKFNRGLDRVLFEPVAKGYRMLPFPIRKGTGNVVSNLSSLLTIPNNILQGNFSTAGDTFGRFLFNSTIGVLGIFDPAAALGIEKKGREDFGQTFGVWGLDAGCYFVLPALGPTTTRDFVGRVADTLLDPVYIVTAGDTEILYRSYAEHNYYYYKGTEGIDFRAKNIESFDSLEENSVDLYASYKSLYLQNRAKNILNASSSVIPTQDDSDWEEIDNN